MTPTKHDHLLTLSFPPNGFTVYELFLQSAFHLSLTVLVRYRSLHLYSAFGWSLPPAWSCNSQTTPTPRVRTSSRAPGFPCYGALTLSGTPFQVDFGPEQWSSGPGQFDSPDHNSPVNNSKPDRRFQTWAFFPLRSPLLRESLLVSLPPLIDMLKFGG